MVASVVPKGMAREGFFKSPERPTPAVIPVNAGKIMAKTIKKSCGFRNSACDKLKCCGIGMAGGSHKKQNQ